MPNFTGFPTNYAPMIHTDQDGTPIEQEKKHTLAQGWLQMFTLLNQILIGRWERPKVDASASVSKCTLTPYNMNIYLRYENAIPSVTLTFPITCYGVLNLFDSSGTLIKSVLTNGNQTVITGVIMNSTITGTLSV